MADETVIHRIQCNICKDFKTVTVPSLGYHKWKRGELIQHALPTVPADIRELLISGTCGKCFDELFAEPDNIDEEDRPEEMI